MVVDTSALLAILLDEAERPAFNRALERAETRLLSAAAFVEASIVLDSRFGASGLASLDLFLEKAGIETVAVDPDQARRARRAYQRFGRGRHPAALNYGDCFSYALAESRGEALLFKGNDFAQTDIEAAIRAGKRR